jgi:hypothetical protein
MKKLLLLTVGLVACGGGGSTDVTKAWVGNWVSAVTQSEMCTTATTTPLNGAFTIAQGTAANDVVTQSANGCDLTWSVVDETATLTPNQKCTVPGSVGGTWDATFTSGSLTLDGGQITVGDIGTAVLTIDATTTNCTFTQSGDFTKS